MINYHHARRIMLLELEHKLHFCQHCYYKGLKYGLVTARSQVDVCLGLMLQLQFFSAKEVNDISKYLIHSNYIGGLMLVYLLLHQNTVHK